MRKPAALIIGILISANLAAAAAEARKPAETTEPKPEPVYEVPQGARDPFQAVRKPVVKPPESENAGEDGVAETEAVSVVVAPTETPPTPEEYLAGLDVSALMNSSAAGGVAIINGKFCEVGTQFVTRVRNANVTVTLIRVEADPPRLTLRHGDRVITCALQAEQKGELQ